MLADLISYLRREVNSPSHHHPDEACSRQSVTSTFCLSTAPTLATCLQERQPRAYKACLSVPGVFSKLEGGSQRDYMQGISDSSSSSQPYTRAENPRLSIPGLLDGAQGSLQLFAFKSDLVWGWHSDSPGRTSHPLSQQNATETKEHEPGKSAARFVSLIRGTLPSSTFSTLNPSQQSPGSSQAPGTGGDGAQWDVPAAAEAPPREERLPMSSRRRDFRCPAEGGGGANCCGTERWAGGGQAAQGLPRDSGRSRAAAGVGRAGGAAGPGRRGFEAGPRAGRPRHPGGAARRRVCPAAERRREPAGALRTLWQPGPGVLGELLLPGTPSWTSPPKGNVSGRPAEGASG
ncbi:hypothetical protein R6Z07M_007205 [Ovis aries]